MFSNFDQLCLFFQNYFKMMVRGCLNDVCLCVSFQPSLCLPHLPCFQTFKDSPFWWDVFNVSLILCLLRLPHLMLRQVTDLQAELADTKTALKASCHWFCLEGLVHMLVNFHIPYKIHFWGLNIFAITFTNTMSTEGDRGGLAGKREAEGGSGEWAGRWSFPPTKYSMCKNSALVCKHLAVCKNGALCINWWCLQLSWQKWWKL